MEDLSKKVPLMNRWILKNVDDKTLVNVKEASQEINQVLVEDRFFWIRMMYKHDGSFKEFQEPWKRVISRTPVGNVKQLALAVHQFFKDNPIRHKKQYHPLFIAAKQGSLKLCGDIIKKTGDLNPKRMEDGCTPLHFAAQNGHLEVCKYLALRLEDKNPGGNDGWTPLHLSLIHI